MASYIPSTKEERLEMLKAIGLSDYRELYKDVPAEMILEDGALNIPELRDKAKLTLVSAVSIVEGGAHDVLLKDTTNSGK